MRKFVLVIVVMVTVFAIGGNIALYANTIGSLFWPYCICIVATALIGLKSDKLWQKLTKTNRQWINQTLNIIVLYPILTCVYLSVNYFGTAKESNHIENAVVERIYTKTRHHTKRISRRAMGVGEAYKVYYAEVRFPDNRIKEISVNQRQWHSLHCGDTMKLNVAMGALGIPVIKRKGSVTTVPPSDARVQ